MHARSFLTPLRTPLLTWAVLLPLAAGLSGCVQEKKAAPLPGNLLADAKVVATGVANVERTTDGLLAVEGDFWDTGITARFTDPKGQITWDLGSARRSRRSWSRATTTTTTSWRARDDGQTFKTAVAVRAGQRPRHAHASDHVQDGRERPLPPADRDRG